MKSTKLLTIGLPIYNEEKYLAKTIESVLNQTFANFKLIISDNCSTDNSYHIAKQYAEQDKRIEITRHPENIGALNNFRYSLDMADSTYFVWLGAHDLFLKDYLKQSIEILEENPHIVMVYPKSLLIDQNDIVINPAASDDIDTVGLSLEEGLFKVARKLDFCTSIHGVFRTNILKQLPFESIIGSDHLLLYVTALYGDIRMIEIEGIKQREVRKETCKEAQKRWIAAGLYQENPDGLSPYVNLVFKHIEYTWKYQNLSLQQKIVISLGLKKIFSKRFGVGGRDLFRQMSSVFFNMMYLFLKKRKK